MRGTLYLANEPGRALRRRRAAVQARHALYCSGEFSSGDRIYIAFMGADGGQYAVATAATHFDSVTLHALLGPLHADAQQRVRTCADDTIIVREADVEWLWPPA